MRHTEDPGLAILSGDGLCCRLARFRAFEPFPRKEVTGNAATWCQARHHLKRVDDGRLFQEHCYPFPENKATLLLGKTICFQRIEPAVLVKVTTYKADMCSIDSRFFESRSYRLQTAEQTLDEDDPKFSFLRQNIATAEENLEWIRRERERAALSDSPGPRSTGTAGGGESVC